MDPRSVLATLAKTSATTWLSIGECAFFGDVTIETKNTMYRFHNGVFVSRSRKPTRTSESPLSMRGIRLIGFLSPSSGRWSLSPRWSMGSLAVLWRAGGIDETSFLLTSASLDYSLMEPTPRSKPAPAPPPDRSDVFRRVVSRPPTLRRPAPPSMTRVMPFVPGEQTSLTST
jgi:hypothetical protein